MKEKADKLPIIIPLVVYHGGEHKWNLRTSLGEWITGYDQLPPEVHKYIPNFEYFLHDLTQYKEEDQKMNAMLKIIQLMFRDVFTKDHEAMLGSILRALYYLNDLEDQQTAITFFETWMRYLLYAANTLTETDIHDIIDHVEKTFPEGSDIVMTLAERLEQKGKEEGIKEGKREGATNALVKTSVRLIEKYIAPVPNDIVQQLKQQHISTLEKIIENVYEHKTLEEIKQYLK
ncbi:hypothetical protein JCM21714_4474 [Gracilibacillus boraciitolerans JCM 21714]|uniref:Transposase (putative) YhgA-like domain-containing protein n=1 Tax=Gracilibacillus boraciitolerans JCM 21714 TaxID=1298598 RepID=W4VPE6_9BACI|nr:hypothetical protein JCM21714_4474 [Gracilibacillus boraciitolerans JCM 21714]